DQHLEIYQSGQSLIRHPLSRSELKNQRIYPENLTTPPHQPRHYQSDSSEEEKRLRALDPTISAYLDFILATRGLQRHQYLRRLLALSQSMSPELFVRSVQRAHRYQILSLETLQKIAWLHLQEGHLGPTPAPVIDQSFRDRPAYRAGSLTDS